MWDTFNYNLLIKMIRQNVRTLYIIFIHAVGATMVCGNSADTA